TNTPTDAPTSTDTPSSTPSDTPTATETVTNTPTITVTPSDTPAPTDTPTNTPTDAPTGTDTPSPTPTDAPTPEAEPGSIALGETLEGTINNANPVVQYTFEVQAGDTIQIRLVGLSDTLDPTLILLDANGNQIARNDDESFTVNDALIETTLPTDGRYTIVATRYREAQGDTEGQFSLTLQTAETVTPGIALGETVSGTINDDTYEIRFNFTGGAGDVVTIDMNAAESELDSLLILLGPDGRELTQNDDVNDSTRDSRISSYVLPQDGAYTIVATRYEQQDGDTQGRFTLTLTEGVIDTSGGEVTTVSDTITTTQWAMYYTYTTTTTTEVVNFDLVATSGNLDPLLILVGPDGREIIRNDDASEGVFNSRISNLPLDQLGEYTLIATRFGLADGDTTGGFDLSVSPGIPGGEIGGTLSQPIERGDTVRGTLASANSQGVYTIQASAGDRLTLELNGTSGDLDTLLILTDAYGNEIARNDDADNTTDSRLDNVEVPEDGYYSIIVMPFQGTGSYELTLE
ncbi:MAG: pre-peptidase C-terminal domain-containing protein, partial [Cutibacterium acnes]|nr:pre-peptidase C-terminal domain-containing protein [Cutibacterium acnes]